MTTERGPEEACRLLCELRSILQQHKERNWIRGIEAAIGELEGESGIANQSKFDAARSIYKTMNQGGRGFAEYFIWHVNEDERIAANQKLDSLRSELWKVFEL
ncbi:MAG: hypothetical protein KF778_02465 [Rhodocyclaceae bacterium]|nr:hypothetical protein [Rhodocyclaceae bacterium]